MISILRKVLFAAVVSLGVALIVHLVGGTERLRSWTRNWKESARIQRVQSGQEDPAPMIAFPGEPPEELEDRYRILTADLPWRASRGSGGCDYLETTYPHLRGKQASPWPEKLDFCHAEAYSDPLTGLHLSKGVFTNGSELVFEKPANEIHIAVVGASSIEGYAIENLSWALLLEEFLNAQGTDLLFRSHNYGIGGVGSGVVRWRVENEITRRPYDFVIIYTGLNDITHGELFTEETANAIDRFLHDGHIDRLDELHPWFVQRASYWRSIRAEIRSAIDDGVQAANFDHFELSGLVPERAARARASFESADRISTDYDRFDSSELRTMPPALVGEFSALQNVRAAAEAVIASGATPIIVAPPINIECIGYSQRPGSRVEKPFVTPRYPMPYEDLAAYLTGPYRRALEAIATESGVPFVDVHELWGALACRNNSIDAVHPGWAGIEVAKERFAEEILRALDIHTGISSAETITMFNDLARREGTDRYSFRDGYGNGEFPDKTEGPDAKLEVSKLRVPFRPAEPAAP